MAAGVGNLQVYTIEASIDYNDAHVPTPAVSDVDILVRALPVATLDKMEAHVYDDSLDINAGDLTVYTIENQIDYEIPPVMSDPGAYSEQTILESDFNTMQAAVEALHAMPKITSIDADAETYVTTGNWPVGSYERGLFDDSTSWYQDAHPVTFQYYTAHPRVRRSCEFGRGYIWSIESGYTYSGVAQTRIKQAVDYLASVQISGDPWDSSRDGSWIAWTWRKGREELILDESYWDPPGTDNRVDTNWFSVGRALSFISMAYVQAVQDGVTTEGDTDYTDPLDNGITNLLTEIGDTGVVPGNPNANYHAVAIWGLVAAYKAGRPGVTIADIYEWVEAMLLAQDTTPGSDHEGCFYHPDNTDDANGQTFYHDTRINYHAINIRGMVEAFMIWPDNSIRDEIRDACVLAINHVIDKRYAPDNTVYSWYKATNGDDPNPSNTWTQELELMLAGMCRFLVAAENDDGLNTEDKNRILKAMHRTANGLSKNSSYFLAGWGAYKATMDWWNAGATGTDILWELP